MNFQHPPGRVLEAGGPGSQRTWKPGDLEAGGPYLLIDYTIFVQYIHISIDFFVTIYDIILCQKS